jgi:hypothetical protein
MRQASAMRNVILQTNEKKNGRMKLFPNRTFKSQEIAPTCTSDLIKKKVTN